MNTPMLTQDDKPRVFISHAWENKPLVLKLEAELKAAGAEVWVDHSGIRGGDNLPKRISDALEWCNILLLIWSDAARKSEWVEEEWTNAKSLKRKIIPCLLDKTPLPGILANKAYLDFSDTEQGISQLAHALKLAPKTTTLTVIDPVQRVTNVLHSPLIDALASAKLKSPQILLRKQPLDKLSGDDVKSVLMEKEFFDTNWNKQAKGLLHEYEKIKRDEQELIVDRMTGLTWQKSGSPYAIIYSEAKKYIHDLNNQNFGSHNDWHLPTLEEAMSLIEPEKKNGNLYISPMFDQTQRWVWTADRENVRSIWVVYFIKGLCRCNLVNSSLYVRAVRRES